MTPSIESVLTAAAPPVCPPGPEVRRELDALVAAAEAAAAPVHARSRARSRVVLSGLAAAGVLGLGAGASAAGVLPAPSWAPWYDDPAARHSQTLSSGSVCEVTYGVKAIEDESRPTTPALRSAALTASRTFVAGFDFAAVDVGRAMAQVPATATSPDATRAERETFVVQYVVQQRLDRFLRSQDLPETIAVSTAQTCTGDGS